MAFTDTPAVHSLRQHVADHFHLYREALGHPQLVQRAGKEIDQRAYEQAVINGQAFMQTAKGNTLSITIQKDISKVAFEGHGRFHDSAGGSGPRYVSLNLV